MSKILVIILGTAVILTLSKRSLLRPTVHGFYRFFAFEAILFLIVMNSAFWGFGMGGWMEILARLFLITSLVLAICSFYFLIKRGKPVAATSPNATTLGFENTTQLVTTDVYRWIRHPMYASLLYLAWGSGLKNLSLWSVGLMLVVTIALIATAKVEEKENLTRFGEAYRQYMSRTRRFIPFVY
ncbi:MAG: isoprenylcysteine carboxylmethyltransferase family protein [Elusimicrobiota bacterium]|jgi:protein-S-isoprenylcysteine O-methyltransferase Ste14